MHVEEALEHISAIWIFNPRIFYMQFLLSKNGLCMWISAYPLVEVDDFLKVPYLMWAWDFVDMYLIHLRIRIWRGSFHIYLKKWFFWTPKDCCPPWTGAKTTFSSTLNVMISQMVRNETVRFGREFWAKTPLVLQGLRYKWVPITCVMYPPCHIFLEYIQNMIIESVTTRSSKCM